MYIDLFLFFLLPLLLSFFLFFFLSSSTVDTRQVWRFVCKVLRINLVYMSLSMSDESATIRIMSIYILFSSSLALFLSFFLSSSLSL
jgi:hypothetical protein